MRRLQEGRYERIPQARCDPSRQLHQAHSAVKAGLALNPAFAVSRLRANLTASSDNPAYLAQLELVFDGMCKAGVPEE